MTSLLEMYNSRPILTLVIAGTTIVLASEVLLVLYNKLFPHSNKNSKSKRSKKSNGTSSQPPSSSKVLSKEEEALQQFEKRKPPTLWNTVIFFPDFRPFESNSATKQLLYYFESAKVSIQLCMYLVSHPSLAEVIRKKFDEGLLVQVVTDYDTYTAHNNCGVKSWKRTGIEVRMKATGFLMHHKFAVIDEEALITGSLNWTKQGLSCNQENVMITTNKGIVQQYLSEFHHLWNIFAESRDADKADECDY